VLVRPPADVEKLEDQLTFVSETVRAISRTKRAAVIRFEASESSSTQYECGDAYLAIEADRTTASGNKLVAKQKCAVSGHQVERKTFPSVTVPLDEVEGLKVGQRASVVFANRGARTGHVLDVWPDVYTKEYLRIRNTRNKKAERGYF
jgi:hypothetical protein